MNPASWPDPEEQRQQSNANLLLLRVALALIDDARRLGAFETDEAKLAARIAELAEELGGRAADKAQVRAMPLTADRVSLSVPLSESSSVQATLRTDGILLEEGVTSSISAAGIDEADLSPEELETMRQAVVEFKAKQAQPQFHGARFLRTVAAKPQPGAEIQVLAAELFDDGLLVHHTFDQEPKSLESIASDPSGWQEMKSGLRVEDDLGTEYYESGGGGGGGVQVVHSAFGFAPAVPATARTLRISSRSGTVELPL